ncbi:hypothetical protein GCM10022267_54220 [Lentzea roselyniae]|uniref:Uncharacterized protein n=1 Tax=Lentzea roselyniae TaxID=531940 RepID=A0ABP7BHR8_9PSEU
MNSGPMQVCRTFTVMLCPSRRTGVHVRKAGTAGTIRRLVRYVRKSLEAQARMPLRWGAVRLGAERFPGSTQCSEGVEALVAEKKKPRLMPGQKPRAQCGQGVPGRSSRTSGTLCPSAG